MATAGPSAEARVERDRIVSLLGVALVHVLLGYALLAGLGVQVPARAIDTLKLFDVLPAPPLAPKPPPPHPRSARRQGAAAPRNLRSTATPIVAPPIVVHAPPPIVAAPLAGLGAEPSAGASSVRGPGSGSGGRGDGNGGGGVGDGDGAGGTPLRWRSGRIKDSDYPRTALAAGVGGTVQLRFTVGVDGRVSDCTVTGSSGNAELDETTCRLIRQRFRYTPSRDAAGRPVPDVVTGEHEWTVYRPDGLPED